MVAAMAGSVSTDSLPDEFRPKFSDNVLGECGPEKSYEASSPTTLSGPGQTPPQVAGAGRGSPPNSGSIGHPIVCSRPCLYFSVGQCVNGDGCGFCHMSHPKRPPHLDKQHRAKLANMAPETRKLWLLAMIKGKLMELDASESTQAVVEGLTHACGARGVALPEPMGMARADRMLWKAVEALTMRVLVVNLRKNFEELQLPVPFDPEAIIKHCQNLVEARY